MVVLLVSTRGHVNSVNKHECCRNRAVFSGIYADSRGVGKSGICVRRKSEVARHSAVPLITASQSYPAFHQVLIRISTEFQLSV
jgi:hypothetical protein